MDFGAGSAKFLWFCRPLFETVEGVEVTPSCIAFARAELGIDLQPAIHEGGQFGVVTAWHALEHVPADSLKDVVSQLHSVTSEALIISVPNAGSYAARWFQARFPFHDAATHYHQFTAQSLTLLLVHAGWQQHAWFRMGIYSVFCYAQGLINCATNTHNLLYFHWKRGRTDGTLTLARMLVHGTLLLAFIPLACVLTLFDYTFPQHATCLNIVCYKNR